MMSVFDDLPPGAVLPAFTDEDGRRLQSVQDTGQAHLVDVDEAELAAIGLPSFPRQGRGELTESQLEAAAARLVTRGLAEPVPWELGRVRPIGDLLLHAQVLTLPSGHAGLISTWQVPEPPGAVRPTHRITVLLDALRLGVACVEKAAMPADANSPVLDISADLVRLDLLVTAVVATAYGDDTAADRPASGHETLVLFADGSGKQQPSRLRVSGDGHAELESSRHGLLGTKTVREAVDRAGFAEHLRLRLMSAG